MNESSAINSSLQQWFCSVEKEEFISGANRLIKQANCDWDYLVRYLQLFNESIAEQNLNKYVPVLCRFFSWLTKDLGINSSISKIARENLQTSFYQCTDDDSSSMKNLFFESVNQYCRFVEELLFKAAIEGNLGDLEGLIGPETNLNIKDKDGCTLLGWASFKGHTALVKMLIDKGADIELANSLEQTPLILARGETLTLLIKNKANVNAKDHKGFTAIDWSVNNDDLQSAKILIDAKVNLNLQDSDESTVIYALKQMKKAMIDVLINLKDDKEMTALMYACAKGQNILVDLLLKEGALIDMGGPADCTALILASASGQTEIVRTLLANGAEIDKCNSRGNPALCQAVVNGKKDVVELLLQSGANVNLIGFEGSTPLHSAASIGSEEIVNILIKYGADCMLQNDRGRTAWFHAKFFGNYLTAKILKEKMSAEEHRWQKNCLRMIAIGHSAHQKGNCKVPLQGTEVSDVSLEGGDFPYWLKQMSKATAFQSECHSELISLEEDKQLQDLFQSGITASDNKYQNILELINKDLSVILPTGLFGHRAVIYLRGPYFVLCNTGEGSRSSRFLPKVIEVFQYDKTLMTETLLKKIFRSGMDDLESFQKLYFEELPIALNFKPKSLFETGLEELCPLRLQSVGNCSWAGLEAAVWIDMALDQVFSGCLNQAILEKKFKNRLLFNLLYQMGRYLNREQIDRSLVANAFNYMDMKFLPISIENPVANKILSTMQNFSAESFFNKVAAEDPILGSLCLEEGKKALESLPAGSHSSLFYKFLIPIIREQISNDLYDKAVILLNAIQNEKTIITITETIANELLKKNSLTALKSFLEILSWYVKFETINISLTSLIYNGFLKQAKEYLFLVYEVGSFEWETLTYSIFNKLFDDEKLIEAQDFLLEMAVCENNIHFLYDKLLRKNCTSGLFKIINAFDNEKQVKYYSLLYKHTIFKLEDETLADQVLDAIITPGIKWQVLGI